ncbi:MAG: SRPBCC family protein [Planctomycetaceae bacterium]
MIQPQSRHSEVSVDDSRDKEIVLSRVFDAPRELVWKVWTDPAHVVNWWGPRGFTNTTKSMDVKVGGKWSYTMHGPDGRDYENLITYLEVDEPARLAYKHGGAVEAEPVNFQVTVNFEPAGADGKQTRVTSRMVFPSAKNKDFVIREYNALEGGKQHLTRLGEYLDEMLARGDSSAESMSPPFVIIRVVKASLDIVFRAWTEREQLMQWFGPKGTTMPTCSLDLRPDGIFHYAMQFPNGYVMWGRWVFREIVAPEKLVFVSSFSDEAGHLAREASHQDWPLEMLLTVTFEEHAGFGKGTVVTVKSSALNATDAERATFLAGFDSMTQGWTGTFEQLDEFLAGK